MEPFLQALGLGEHQGGFVVAKETSKYYINMMVWTYRTGVWLDDLSIGQSQKASLTCL